MIVKADKPMRRQYRSTSDWEIYDPASTYPEFNTSRRGEYNDNLFAFTRVDVSEIGLSDGIHLYIGTEGNTLEIGDIGIIYDFRTHRNVSDALANESKYQDFYLVLEENGYYPTNAIVIEAVSQAQAMVNAAFEE